jgi:peptide/nickel transport system substrate-binding protein/oligopeptide transport system substrate-binding protein
MTTTSSEPPSPQAGQRSTDSVASGRSLERSPSIFSNANGRRTYWIVPGVLLGLFVLTAFATRLVKKEALYGGASPADLMEPVQGGVFRYPLFSTIRTLDPAKAVFRDDVTLVQQLYDGLTAFDEHLNVVPALAKFWEISADGMTYTFELRADARFHNGRRVTAEDCVFSFERLLTPGKNEANYHYYSRIVGAEDFRAGRADHVEGLEAVDEDTFVLRFNTPFVPALSVLSMYASKILPKEEFLEQGDDFFLAPIGTGAFQFSRWIEPDEDPGVPRAYGLWQGIRLEANGLYFAGRPHLDAVVFRFAGNSPDYDGEPRPFHEVADILESSNILEYGDWVRVETNQLLALRYLYFPNVAPYDDPRVRLAVNFALDKRSFLDAHRSTAGMEAARGIVPPGIPGFIPRESLPGQDLERAKELLADAGFPGGHGLPPLELVVLRDERSPRNPVAAAQENCLKFCLSEVGIELVLVPVRSFAGSVLERFADRPVLREDVWFADFPDPDNFLRTLFHSSGPRNEFAYENQEVDRLLDQVWSETSYSKRNELYHDIEERVLNDSPIIPLDYERLRYFLRPNVRGFKITPLGAPYIELRDVWLDEEPTAPRARESQVEL